MLVAVSSGSALARFTPDLEQLRAACDRLGLLGCYLYSRPTAHGRIAARMFATSIGVPEDIANANSTACLAARLAQRNVTRLTVDMGDALDRPATIIATTRTTRSGLQIRVGGAARVVRTVRLGADLVSDP